MVLALETREWQQRFKDSNLKHFKKGKRHFSLQKYPLVAEMLGSGKVWQLVIRARARERERRVIKEKQVPTLRSWGAFLKERCM
jgi:hypothetical protein